MSFIFKKTGTVSNDVRLAFQTNGSNVDYYVDNVSIKEVSVIGINDASDDSTLYTNPTMSPSIVTLTGQYCDIDNNTISGSITLAPYASKILLSCFSNNDYACNNHETHDSAPSECTTIDDE